MSLPTTSPAVDFSDNDNDLFDDAEHGHGTGEGRQSTLRGEQRWPSRQVAEECNCSGSCCVGDSFVADVNNFGQAETTRSTTTSQVIEEALGTLNMLRADAV